MPYETRCKTSRTSSKVRETKSHRIFSQRTHPIHPIGPKTDILVRLILFGCFQDRLVALQNSVQNGPNYCKSSCHEVTSNISQRTHPIHPIGHYTDVLVHSYYLGAFGTIWLPYKTRCKTGRTCVKVRATGRTCVKVRATKWRRNFSQQTHLIHPIGP